MKRNGCKPARFGDNRAKVMAAHPQVKRKFMFLLLPALLLVPPAAGAQTRDAQEILKSVRMAQTGQHRTLTGRLRVGSQITPLRLVLDGDTIRYEFTNPDEALIVRLDDNGSRLDDKTAAGTKRVGLARLDDKVRGTDLTYEDVSLRFLYWKDAVPKGDDSFKLRDCWVLELHPGKAETSQYSTVRAWIEKASGGLLKAECFGANGKLAMRFQLVSIQKDKTEEGIWIPKSLKIERMEGDTTRDKMPTYLELEAPGK
jgi:outer membrane lipoprotein-sorting protein